METKLKKISNASYASMHDVDQEQTQSQPHTTDDALIDDIKCFLQDKKYLDVYQLLAFKWNKPKESMNKSNRSCLTIFEKTIHIYI